MPRPDLPANPAVYAALLWFGRLAMLLMVVSVLYAGWMAAANWHHIGV